MQYPSIFFMIIFSMMVIFVHCTADINQSNINTADDYITGEVQEIQQGRDGYTAKISTDNHQVYYATISIPNLGENAHQFRKVEVDETISIKGDVWKMNEEMHVTVRELK